MKGIKMEIKDRLRNFKYPPTLQTKEKRDRAKEKFIDYNSNTGKAICSCPILVTISQISNFKFSIFNFQFFFLSFA